MIGEITEEKMLEDPKCDVEDTVSNYLDFVEIFLEQLKYV